MRLRQRQQEIVRLVERQLGVDAVGEGMHCIFRARIPRPVDTPVVAAKALQLLLDVGDELVAGSRVPRRQRSAGKHGIRRRRDNRLPSAGELRPRVRRGGNLRVRKACERHVGREGAQLRLGDRLCARWSCRCGANNRWRGLGTACDGFADMVE